MTNFWPSGIEGAVSLSFDDGAPSQLATGIPMLDDAGLSATFYLCPGKNERYTRRLEEWQAASARGHEMGNHTCDHPCSCNFGFSHDRCLEKLNLDDLADTIDRATDIMDADFPEQEGVRSFCYPCYQSYVGHGATRQSYVPLVAHRFRVGRGGGERANDPRRVDLAYAWAWDVSGRSGSQMIEFVEQAAGEGRWAILCMHGVGADHLTVETADLQQVVDHLSTNRHRIITDTVIATGTRILVRRRDLDQAPGA